MKIIGIIPARYDSSRFPGKPLADILGKTMIQRVYEQSLKCTTLDEVIVATDDKRIYNHVLSLKGKVMMTLSTHQSGTDRCNEVIKNLNDHYDIAVNIQGDEPFIHPNEIDHLTTLFVSEEVNIATLAKKTENKSIITSINHPKAIFDKNGFALNFCREIPKYSKEKDYFKHVGIYAYRTKTLAEICKLATSKNEIKESLEQLRWLDNNYQIKVGITTYDGVSIDTPEDIKKIEAQIR